MASGSTLKARWVLPVAGDPIEYGIVEIEGDRIVAVRRGRAGESCRDLGDVAILPGMVNAHVHLELSGVAAPLGCPGISMVDWIGLVVAARRAETYDFTESVRYGLAESAEAGVAAIGDIVQEIPAGEDGLTATTGDPPAMTAFLELIGPTESRAREALDKAARCLAAGQGRGGVRLGLSPHAPYSVHPDLFAGACRLSRAHKVPVAFHLAESREEMELLECGAGPFRELLEGLDAWDPAVQRAGRRPLDYLNVMADADRALVIHGNYLNDEEIRYLARRRDRMSVVYCPRTHAWFGHEPYPLESMLAAGVRVALGTDSRASSPDLDLWEEMRTVASRHSEVCARKIIEMGTLAGAEALGLAAEYGSLEVGKRARFVVIPLAERGTGGPHEWLLRG